MNTQTIHIPSGRAFDNRKEAKTIMGHSNYNKAVGKGEIIFIKTHDFQDIII